ncbi:hypothetical protein MMC13_007042 [Lambiella insularis]|nr:hypothetical protein [Lambiella insularis]
MCLPKCVSIISGLVLFTGFAISQSYSNLSSSSSLSTTKGACQASQDAWVAASNSFYASVASGRSAGIYSTSVSTVHNPETYTVYSYDLSGVLTETYGKTTITDQYAVSTVATITTISTDVWTNTYIGPSFDVPFPRCSFTSTYTHSTYSGECNGCTLVAPNVQLIYFPVSTVPGNPNLTITPTGTSLPTGVYGGKTYTSGNVYFKYDNISAVNGCYAPVGSFYPGAIVTLRSEDVSSLRNDGTYFDGSFSFNYADLNYPVPYEAWIGQFGCANEYPGCRPIETGPYNPYVSIPSQVKGLDPAWASCTMDPTLGSWDPPYALIPAKGPLTEPGHVTTSTATPANTPTSPLAQSTPFVLSSQSVGAMNPSTSKTADLPALPETTTSSAIASADPSDDPRVSSSISSSYHAPSIGLPATSRGSQVDSSLQPSFSAKVVLTISNSVITLSATANAISVPGQTTPLQLSAVNPAASLIIVGSQTLTPGSEILVSGTTYSLLPTPSAIIIDGSTISLSPASALGTQPQAITVGASVITENPASDFVVGSQTLTPGGQITVSGEVLSLDPGATNVVFGGTSTQGLGALIMSGFAPVGAPPSATSTTAGIHFSNGAASRRKLGWWADMKKLKVLIHVALVLVVTIGFQI